MTRAKKNLILNTARGSALVQAMVSLGIFALVVNGVVSLSTQSASLQRIADTQRRADAVAGIVAANTSSALLCNELVANNKLKINGNGSFDNNPNAFQPMELDSGICTQGNNPNNCPANKAMWIAAGENLDYLGLNVVSFTYQCKDEDNNGSCDCLASTMPPNNCIAPAGPGSRIYPGTLNVLVENQTEMLRGVIGTRRIPISIYVDNANVMRGCQPEKGPEAYCIELGGHWISDPIPAGTPPYCSFLPADFKCPANQAMIPDSDGDGMPECRSLTSGCAPGYLAVGIQDGVIQCQAVPGAYWDVGAWSGCNINTDPPSNTRTVVCRNSAGIAVADINCTNLGYPKPISDLTCSDWTWKPAGWQCLGDNVTSQEILVCSNQRGTVSPVGMEVTNCGIANPASGMWTTGPWDTTNCPVSQSRVVTCDTPGNCVACPQPIDISACDVCLPVAQTWVDAVSGDGNCNATPAAPVTDGAQVCITDSTDPTTGTACYTCNYGGGGLIQDPGATCVVQGCALAANVFSWQDPTGTNTCLLTNDVTVPEGSTLSVSDSVAPETGSVNVSCNAGVPSIDLASRVCNSAACVAPAGTLVWIGGGGEICSNSGPVALPDGAPLTPVLDGIGPLIGSADFSCNASVFSAPNNPICGGSNCNQAPGTLTWVDGGNVCSNSNNELLIDGAAAVVVPDNNAPTTGGAPFTCTAGVATVQAGAVCNSVPIDGSCNWGAGLTVIPDLYPGPCTGFSMMPDCGLLSANCPVDGQTWDCEMTVGAWCTQVQYTCSCAGANCDVPAGGLNWGANPNFCFNDNATTVIHGAAAVGLNDSVGPLTGSVQATCTDGVLSTFGDSCVSPDCFQPANSLNWTVGGRTCFNTVDVNIPNNNQAGAVDNVGPDTGSATFACNNGVLNLNPINPICDPPAGCSAAVGALSWNGAMGETCFNTLAVNALNGANGNAADSIGPETGGADFPCANGAWGVPVGTSCTLSNDCNNLAPGTLQWTENGNTCTNTVVLNIANAATQTANDTVNPTTGSADFTCNNGVPSAPVNAVCSALGCVVAAGTTWTENGNTCAADVAVAIPNGGNANALDATGDPTGSANFACVNSTLQPPSAQDCNLNSSGCWTTFTRITTTNNCFRWGFDIRTETETQEGANCTIGQTATVFAPGCAGADDCLTVQCNVPDSQDEFLATCGACAASPSCTVTAGVTSWTVNGLTCVADAGANIASGGSFNAADTNGNETGTITFGCMNGTLQTSNATCSPGIDGVWAQEENVFENCPAGYIRTDLQDDDDAGHRLQEDSKEGPRHNLCIKGITGFYWDDTMSCGGDLNTLIRDDQQNDGRKLWENDAQGGGTSFCLTGLSGTADARWELGGCLPGYYNVGGIIAKRNGNGPTDTRNLNQDAGASGSNVYWCVRP